MSLCPLVSFDEISLAEANQLLERWGHRMGPMERGNLTGVHFALMDGREPVAVAMAASLIREHVGAGLQHIDRDSGIELARLCAARPHLCRVALRLWREFVLPRMVAPSTGQPYRYAISYQDADLHNGNTYRFDGWNRSEVKSHSGTDKRSGRKGRDKWIWWWEVPAP